MAEKNVIIHGAEIMLTNREFEILYLLVQSPGRIFSKEQIYDIGWQEPYSGDYHIVMSHIRHIREKIEDNPGKPLYIQTVWGMSESQTLKTIVHTVSISAVGRHFFKIHSDLMKKDF